MDTKIDSNKVKKQISEKLDKAGVKYEFIPLPADIPTEVKDHMDFHGKGIKYAMPTIIFKVDDRFIAVQKRGDQDINEEKVKKFVGAKKIRYADRKEVGIESGMVPVSGLDMEYFVDEKVFELDEIYTGIGNNSETIKFSPEGLKVLNNPEIGDFALTIEDIKFDTALSGITPSSTKGLHLGNYFGAVKPHVEFQQHGQCFYFVANNHALNTVFNGKEVAENTVNVFMEYLAFGIDPDKTTFFVESDIPAILYLESILNNVVTVAELKRMHGYKDKLQKGVDQDQINIGLFNYPILMAADILAFAPDLIPVGEDQAQHVEIAREIARTFNNRYGEVLKIPELFVKKDAARIKGTDGERKMSKSLGNDIPIFGTEKEIRNQIMNIKTDPNRIHATDPGDPDRNVAFEYLRLLDYDRSEIGAMEDKYRSGSIGDVEIKQKLYEHFLEYFKGFRAKKEELAANIDYVYELREKGAAKANEVAEKTLEKVKKATGLAKPKKKVQKGEVEKKVIIQFDDFMKLDIRIGTIVEAEQHPKADKLLKLIIRFGEEERQILAGIAEMKKPEELIGKQVPVLFNLAPREMRGLESQGMIMAGDDSNGIVLLHPEREVESGAIVR